MGLETGTYITDLVATNPVGATDAKSEGDNHLRLIKATLQASFPDASAPFYIHPGIITTSKPAAFSQTWNDVAVTFKAQTITITDTASAAGSLFVDYLVGAVSKYSVSKAGNVLIAGTLGVSGVSSFAAGVVGGPGIYLSTDTTSGLYRIGADNIGVAISGAKVLDISATGLGVTGTLTLSGIAYIGDTANANSTLGLTINQGAADNEILSLKSSDVAHGMTTVTETDTFCFIQKASAATGGVAYKGLSEAIVATQIHNIATMESSTRTTAAPGACEIRSWLKNGTTHTDMSANVNLLIVASGNTTRFILDSDGDSHQDVGTAWTNFDHLDDVAMLDALSYNVARADDPIKRKFGEWMLEKRHELEANKIVAFNKDGHHFVNMSKLTMLNTGAIRYLGERQKDEAEFMRSEIAQLKGKLAQLEYRV